MAYRNTPYHVNFNGGFSGLNNPGARTYWVGAAVAADGITPSDSNNGTSPQQAFSTIQKGLDSCVAGRGDIVAVLPGSYTVTTPITMTTADVSLVSAHSYPERGYGRVIITAAATYDNNLIQVDADNCIIDGFIFECGFTSVTANQEIVQLNSTNTTTDIYGAVVRNCFFDGTRAAGAASVVDSDCDFLRVGLDSNDRAFHSIVENCVFRGCDQDAIVVTAAPHTIIRNCRIYDGVASELTRYGINIASVGCLVQGCNISTADTATPGGGIYVNSTLAEYIDNRIWARGANTICILAAASATGSGRANWLTAVAAGNLTDYTTDNTSPSADANFKGIFAATPGQAAAETPTVDGS